MGAFFQLMQFVFMQVKGLSDMHSAFVLMNAELGKENKLVKELRAIPNVQEVYGVYGVYDVLMEIAADSMETLREIITTKVRKLDGVKSTLTMIIVKDE